MRNKILSLLVLLLTAASGAWAEGETLLLTIENKDYPSFKSGSMTFDDKVTVTFSNTVSNWGDSDGWYSSRTPSLLTVAGTNGYTITSCKFYTNSGIAKTGYTVEGESPSVYLYNDSVYTDASKSLKIGYPGITKIEVYGGVASSEPAIEVTTNAASEGATFTEATFAMPAFDATVNYELVRDMTVDVDATIADRIRIKKENNLYVVVTDGQLTPVVSDKISGTAVAMTATTDYTAQLQKKTEGDTPTWADATTLSVGTFRYVITGTGLYDGKITTNEFQLFEGYEVTIPAGEYITYYKDEKLTLDKNETEAKLYTISSVSETEAVLSSELTVAKANMPILVFNGSGNTKSILLIPTEAAADEVTAATQFVGTLDATTIPASATGADNYALNGYAFVWVKNEIAVAANKCWLQIGNQPAAARAMTRSIVGGNGTTGIDAIENVTIDNEGWYDLQGRKLQSAPNRKGIYIHNGKKVVVRK